MIWYEADTETTTSAYEKDETQVWLWYSENIDESTDNKMGVSMDSFFSWIESLPKSCSVYFHNLDFDGDFIINWLWDYRDYVRPNKTGFNTHLEPGQWTSMSAGVSMHYKIMYRNNRNAIITFKDSLKVLLESVSSLQNVVEKKKIDYNITKIPHSLDEVSEEQKVYVKKDVQTVIPYMRHIKKALEHDEVNAKGKTVKKNGLKLTIAGSSQSYFKQVVGKDNWDFYFTNKIKAGTLDKDGITYKEGEWDDLNHWYVGGYCIVGYNKQKRLIYAKDRAGKIYVFDVNSLYTWAMEECPLPYGYPIYDCKKKNCDHIKLLEVDLDATIKDGYEAFIPSALKSSFMNIDWLREVHQVCYFTDRMWDLVQKYYNVEYFNINREIHFNHKTGIFHEGMQHWMDVKKNAVKGSAEYKEAKLMMNGAYGKFGMNPLRKTYYLREATEQELQSSIHKYGKGKRKAVFDYYFKMTDVQYLPMAIFITSYAKCKTIELTELVSECTHCLGTGESGYLYSDTDSVHAILCNECLEKLKTKIHIHPKDLGAWDNEGIYKYGYYFGRKKYIEFDDIDSLNRNIGFAGVDKVSLGKYTNKELIEQHTDDPSKPFKFTKRMKRKVAGGIILEDKEVHIK